MTLPEIVKVRGSANSTTVHAAFAVKANGSGQNRRTLCNKGSKAAFDTGQPVNCGTCLREQASPKWAWLKAPPATPSTTPLHEGGHVRH